MRVAFIVNGFPRFSETFLLDQITGVIDQGHRVRIFAKPVFINEPVHPDVEEYHLTRHVSYHVSPWRQKGLRRLQALGYMTKTGVVTPIQTFRLMKYLMGRKSLPDYSELFFLLSVLRWRPDILICHFGPNGLLATPLKDIVPGLIFVTMFHGYDVRMALEGDRGMYRCLFSKADLILANSESTYQKLVELGAEPRRLRLHYETFDYRRFARPNGHMPGSDKGLVLLTVARLVPEKGLEYALRAFRALKDLHPEMPITYRILGSGPLEDDLRKLARELGIESRVVFAGIGDSNRVKQELQKAHLFLLPSVQEAFGVVLLEAQAAGVPIVASNVGGIPEAVMPGRSALLSQPGDVEDIARKLDYLIQHPEIRAVMAEAGQSHVRDNFDKAILNDRLMQYIHEVRTSRATRR